MGVSDEASKAAADELLSGRRARRVRRESFRDELLALLTEYGTLIEALRTSYLRILDLVRAGEDFEFPAVEMPHRRPIATEQGRPVLGRGERWWSRPVTVAGVTWDRWIEDEDLDLIARTTAEDLRIQPSGDNEIELRVRDAMDQYLRAAAQRRDSRDYRRDARHGQPRTPEALVAMRALDVERATEQLDESWAQLRPRLDDAIGAVAVAYLREMRHDLKARASWLEASIHRYSQRPTSDAELAGDIEDFLANADLWASAIAEVRSLVRGDRPL